MYRKKGFTLVELLVVIAIIALLMGILMPSLNMARSQAQSIVCQSNMKNLALAWDVYHSENEGNLVGAHTYLNDNSSPDYSFCWVERPQKENGSRADFCPTEENEKRGIERGALFPYVEKSIDIYHCGADKRIKQARGSGWRTYSIAGCMNGAWVSGGKIVTPAFKKITQVRRPSDSFVFVEETSTKKPTCYNVNAWQFGYMDGVFIDALAVLHSNKSSFSFADGHVESHKWSNKKTIAFSKGEIDAATASVDNEDLDYLIKGWAIKSKSAYVTKPVP